jgi:hypothetical protein
VLRARTKFKAIIDRNRSTAMREKLNWFDKNGYFENKYVFQLYTLMGLVVAHTFATKYHGDQSSLSCLTTSLSPANLDHLRSKFAPLVNNPQSTSAKMYVYIWRNFPWIFVVFKYETDYPRQECLAGSILCVALNWTKSSFCVPWKPNFFTLHKKQYFKISLIL